MNIRVAAFTVREKSINTYVSDAVPGASIMYFIARCVFPLSNGRIQGQGLCKSVWAGLYMVAVQGNMQTMCE